MKLLRGNKTKPIGAVSAGIVDKIDYLAYVDGLRGVAILLVLMLHVSHQYASAGFHFEILHQYAESGARGVQLFFILSALTLFNSSSRRFVSDRRPYLMFYIRRFFRIYPLWICVVLVWAIANHRMLAEALPSVLFIFGFLRFDAFFEVVPGGWSLFVEETFYALLPILFTKIKNLYSAIVLLICLLLTQALWSKLASSVNVLQSNQYDFFFPLNHWYAFGLGIAAYFLIKNGSIELITKSKKKVMLLDLLVFGALASYLPKEPVIASASLVFLVVISSMKRSIWHRLMNNSILMRFGRYCYSIYLCHFVLLLSLPIISSRIFNTLGIEAASAELKILIILPIFALANLLFASITYNLIEKPGIRIGKRIANGAQAREKRKDSSRKLSPLMEVPLATRH